MTLAVQLAGADRVRPAPQFLSLTEGNRLLHMLRHEPGTGRITQLIAACSGEGTSAVARDLAVVAAARRGVRVLLLDLAPPGNTQLAVLRGGWGAAKVRREVSGLPADAVIHQLDSMPLWVSETSRPPDAGLAGWAEALQTLRQAFELVLIDSPAIDRSDIGLMLAPDADTNLLVVEAERTRAAEARNLRDRIHDMGGRIGGVVLNQRQCHIPRFLQRHV